MFWWTVCVALRNFEGSIISCDSEARSTFIPFRKSGVRVCRATLMSPLPLCVIEASVHDPKNWASPIYWIKQLYKVEREASALGLDSEGIKALRIEKSKPQLDKIKNWVNEMALDPFIKESMRKAVVYLTNQWQHLNRYLEDGDMPISNILTEQAMRGVGVGRKNWMVYW